MYTEYEIRQIPLSVARYKAAVEAFLADNGLRLDAVDYYAGVYRIDSDELLAAGGLDRNVIKCIAVSDRLRDEGMSNRLVSHLISVANERGYKSVKLFTKPENRAIFESLSFRLLAEAPKAILMETGTGGLDSYLAYLRAKSNRFEEYGKTLSHPYTGVVVMNANPFTRGHYYLLRQAAMQVDTLYVIVVKEDRSMFSYAERKAMIEAGTADLQNVVVLEGSDYAISAATFPTYFLKQLSDASDTQMTLDLDLFARHIAPALGATMRFVGSEPTDPLTARYNELMHQLLFPKIEVVEIKRMEEGGEPVNATYIRRTIAEGNLWDKRMMDFVHPVARPYILAHYATNALRRELDCTPKPGLVDQHDSGAHSDMDYALMQQSISAIHPYFARLAELGFGTELPTVEQIRSIGIEAEQAMMQATGGVNTHRGALFSMGLAVIAGAWSIKVIETMLFPAMADTGEPLFNIEKEMCVATPHATIRKLAGLFPKPQGTHGSAMVQQHSAKGALANAQEGYPMLFYNWLPYYREHRDDTYALHKTLLLIMSQIDDTNILYRAGADMAKWVKTDAQALLQDFSLDGVNRMNEEFTRRNISPGGAADMLSLTLFFDAILPKECYKIL